MAKPILYLLNPGFFDGDEGPYYCPYNSSVEGFLNYVPEIIEKIDLRRIDFPRPRKPIIDLIGEENQGTPVLILDENADVPEYAQISSITGRAFVNDFIKIGEYLSALFGVMRPH